MNVDDRDFFEETVTSELATAELEAYVAASRPDADLSRAHAVATGTPMPEAPAFFAAGTGMFDADGHPLTPDEVFATPRAADRDVTQPIPRITMAELVFQMRGEVQAPVEEPETIDELVDGLESEVPTYEADQVELPATSRKIRPRRTRPRARTIAARRLTSIELREVHSTRTDRADRPRTRAECQHEQRPCPWVSCKHHLYLDVNPRTGSIKLNFPDLEPWELEHTCALDVADDGGHTLEEVGDITNLTRERIRQLELRGLVELRGRSRGLR